MKQRLQFFMLAAVLAAVLLWIGGFIVFSRYIKAYRTDLTTHTDAVAVLTGGRNRIFEAIRLYNEGFADFLIISGVEPNVSVAQIEKQNGIVVTGDPDHIILGYEATNTIENAIEVNDAIRRHHIRSVRLVTSFYHLPRSEQEILAQNRDLKILLHPVYSKQVSSRWWKKWGSFCLIASEYHKFVFVYLKNFVLQLTERD
jgi:uncharacterized SAM-binding protein YcdF (DUF218 family)